MSNYLIELTIIHLALVLGYWIFLRNERQYAKMRFYLIFSTFLALIIPLLKLPRLFLSRDQPIMGEVIPLEAVTLTPTPATMSWHLETLLWIYGIVSGILLLKFLGNLFHLFQLKNQSQTETFNNQQIRKVNGIRGSFTFFRWIFLSEDIDESRQDYEAILKHEKAHATLGHTYDLLFFELFTICFWWLPTSWLIKREIRKIHEYQADAEALKWCQVDRYSSILISSTLKSNGWSLASSFHDGLILKRLKAMKQQAKNVSPWKLGALTAMAISLFVVFACSEELGPDGNNRSDGGDLASQEDQSNGEVFKLVEQAPEPIGGMGTFYEYVGKNIRYPLQARRMGIEGKVYVTFVVEKDGSLSNIETIKGIGAGCDEEAVRVLQDEATPLFKPGEQRGRPVRVRMQMPIIFKLNHGKTNPDNSTQGIIILEEAKSDIHKFTVDANYSNGVWSGTVYDEQGGGLPGANIMVAGTQSGTVSDLDGTFKIETNQPNDLHVSFVGYQSVKLSAN